MADETKHEEGFTGQNPYTDPPPAGRRRFYEDPKPLAAASEQQVMQGRGAPPPYPGDQTNRAWQPERYADQKSAERPADTAQPSLAESMGGMTVAHLLSLPREQQDEIIEQMRHRREHPNEPFATAEPPRQQEPGQPDQPGQPPQPGGPPRPGEPPQPGGPPRPGQPPVPPRPGQTPTPPNPQQGSGAGVQRMAPAAPGTMIAGEQQTSNRVRSHDEEGEQQTSNRVRSHDEEGERNRQQGGEDDPGAPPYSER